MNPSWSVFYQNENELETAADLVIHGKVAYRFNSAFVEDDISTYNTNTQVMILNVIKGDNVSVDSSIIVSQMGGIFGNLHVVSAATTLLQENQEVILFLRKNSDDTYRAMNEDEGVYVKIGVTFQNIATKTNLRTDDYAIQ